MTIFEKYILSHFNKITLIPEHVRHNLSIGLKKKKMGASQKRSYLPSISETISI